MPGCVLRDMINGEEEDGDLQTAAVVAVLAAISLDRGVGDSKRTSE